MIIINSHFLSEFLCRTASALKNVIFSNQLRLKVSIPHLLTDTNLLISLHQLIEAQEAPKPTPTVWRLQVVSYLVYHSCPMAREVMFNDSTEAHCQLGSSARRKKKYKQVRSWHSV